ncbi:MULTISPECIES: pyridoxamine 5'-phosphate oxidase family protein [unclassified Methylobacterium]|uniref:pyridoxamine 5'-phosphate oxidase family protein n=1 Tax=unclassified Methylobacterium TaxID=2615210 RepID=UPI0011C1E28D|nr:MULTISPECIES: pyridoxamine 5'-phosphate oxidase family protein [unclassified Methylobacterium]QEE41929.1 pyridoxamine 5'-phosphate oxidase family protein [Methylobacterium sp. WL1]TXN54705.1 pyridoxamine 5'-phosphate oxidase family protein [Methylobacterium sp. WL2]
MDAETREPSTILEAPALRAQFGAVGPLAAGKVLDHLDDYARRFIALAPFLVLASADAAGQADASPRGDAPGFVAVPDARTLVIPDRRGNNRIDSFRNVIENPGVGEIFFVPGIDETLRVNGTAAVTQDHALLEPLAAQGTVPTIGLIVRVREAFFHCGKALMRAQLWDPARHVARDTFPSLGRILAEQTAASGVADAEGQIADSYRTRLY